MNGYCLWGNFGQPRAEHLHCNVQAIYETTQFIITRGHIAATERLIQCRGIFLHVLKPQRTGRAFERVGKLLCLVEFVCRYEGSNFLSIFVVIGVELA